MASISLADIEELREFAPRRRCFADSSDKRNADGSFSLSLRFDSVAELFHDETGLPLRGGPHGPWCRVDQEADIELALEWKAKVGDYVFLRDMLELSVALDVNLAQEGIYAGVDHRDMRKSIGF